MITPIFLGNILLPKEKLPGMVTLTIPILIQIQPNKYWHGLKNYRILQIVEKKLGTKFNSCLLNLYHDGNEGVGWHSDDEKSLGKNTTIASLSFGSERRFSFRHKQTKEIVSLVLEHGSLLVMKDMTQTNWMHSLPKSKKIINKRINLTFRTIVC